MNRTLKQRILGLVMISLVLVLHGTGQAQNPATEERFIEYTKLIEDFRETKVRTLTFGEPDDEEETDDEEEMDDDAYEEELRKALEKPFQLLDEIMTNPDCSREDFAEAAWMKLQALGYVNDADVRRFIQGLDKTKYPEIARFIWLRYLEDMLESWSEEVLEKTAKEIEQEAQRYGKDLPPDVAKLVFLLLAKSETNSEKYNKYRKWLSESSNPESRAFLQALDPDTKPEDENSVSEEISNERKEKWRMWGQLDNAMSQEIQAMSKREKQGKHWKELDQQSHWRIQKNIEDIKKKYYPQIANLLQWLLENTRDEAHFKAVADSIFHDLWRADEETCPNLRKFVLGIDKKKYPKLANELWLRFLNHRLVNAKICTFRGDTEFYDECAKEIEHELFFNEEFLSDMLSWGYGTKLATEILNDKIIRKDPTFEECYKKYRERILKSSNTDNWVEFWEFEERRRHRILRERAGLPVKDEFYSYLYDPY